MTDDVELDRITITRTLAEHGPEVIQDTHTTSPQHPARRPGPMNNPHAGDGMTITPMETCTATARTGNRCQKRPEPGQRVCRMHGGAAPGAKAKAAERILQAKVRGEMMRHNIAPVTDPVHEWALNAGELLAMRNILGAMVNELQTWDYRNVMSGSDEVKAILALYLATIRDCDRTFSGMTRAGMTAEMLRHELTRASREQAESLNRVLTGLGLSEAQLALLPELFRREGLT